MAASTRKSVKHKMTDALDSTDRKKPRVTRSSSSKTNDSGIEMSTEKTAVKKAPVRKSARPTRRKLDTGASSSVGIPESQDSGIGSIDESQVDVKVESDVKPFETNPRVKKAGVSTPKKSRQMPEKTHLPPADLAQMDVSQILALGEGTSAPSSHQIEETDSDESDWEEVGEEPSLTEPKIPVNGVDITLDAPLVSFKRKKREHDIEGEVRRQLKRRQKEIQELMHKVHLLCMIAHVKFVNSVLNSEELLSECHLVLSAKQYYPPKHADIAYLERVVKSFCKVIKLNEEKKDIDKDGLKESLCSQFRESAAWSAKNLVFMFVVFLRSLGLKVRLVMNLVTVPLKPSEKVTVARPEKDKPGPSKEITEKNDIQPKKKSLKESLKRNLVSPKKKGRKNPKRKQNDSDAEHSEHFMETSGKKQKKSAKKIGKASLKEKDEGSDDDFSPVRKKVPPAVKKPIDRRVLSSDDEDKSGNRKMGQDVWVEVFLEAEEKWITVDVCRKKIHCIQFLFTHATQPAAYIVACNNDLTLKDVTKRYAVNWHSDTRKKRVSEAWWSEAMWPYKPPSTAQDKEEDEDIAKQLHDMPLPKAISEYKDHPLYALKRHLLKFEGIYPPDAPTLGFVRGEPVYGRECVVTLRSREIWFKEARVVRPNETPYKIVKSRPKYDKMTGEFKKDLPLELFGVWQTEDYIPPTAVDGKVPRNEYGNVDLFKPCMLPGGTVHLQIPALNRVARKLNIDCAPAVVGFDFHSGGSHPVHDGFVVCEEFKDVLLEAWNKEIDESARRAEERREKRVYGNWRRLIRGLIIRENLKVKYAFGENSDEEGEPGPTSISNEPPTKKKKGKFGRA